MPPPVTSTTGPFWVIWRDTGDAASAQKSAFILGGTSTKPPVAPGFLEAGSFTTYADAQAYKAQIGTGAILPAPGTNLIGNVKGPTFTNPIADVGNFFHALTQSSTWVRVGEVALGGILLFIGVRAVAQGSSVAGTQARKATTKPVRKVASGALKVAVPEARLAGRVVSKKVAPKTTARVAAHREQVRKYGAKKPYTPPAPRKPIEHRVTRESHIYHHKGPAKP